MTGVESFALSRYLKLKKDDNGFDLKFIMERVKILALNYMQDNKLHIQVGFDIIYATTEALKKVDVRGINQLALFDSWILELRGL